MAKGKPPKDPKWGKDPNEQPYMVPGSLGHPPTKKSCKECPLRRVHPNGWLGGYTPEEYVTTLHSDAAIACHLSPGFQERDLSQQRHCTGVAAYRANVGKAPRSPGAAKAVELVGPDKETFFASPTEFLKHHKDNPGGNS